MALAAAVGAAQAVAPLSPLEAQAAGWAPLQGNLLPEGSPLHGPYAPLHGGGLIGRSVAESPDPLVRYVWNRPGSLDELQSYALAPTVANGTADFRRVGKERLPLRVEGTGSLCFDFGVESAGWLEFDSDDLSGIVEMSVSEYNEPAVVNSGPRHRFKTAAPVRYGNTFRLELNPELYEGVRFGWIHVLRWERPWHIRAVRAVCQAKPVNYEGSFRCSDSRLTRIWYTGAYVVRANLSRDSFGAILMDRGDRISWTGDAHPSQSAAMTAFGNWEFVLKNLRRTATDSNGIESYPLYWVLSVVEYYQKTGDRAGFEELRPRIEEILQHGEAIYQDPTITFYGWDERLGAGFEEPENDEAKNAYRMLFVRACREFAHAASKAGDVEISDRYEALAMRRMKYTRDASDGWTGYGLHALADAVNTGALTDEEMQAAYRRAFTDRLDRLSYSPFNQYFILQALTRMGRMEEALAVVHDVWGGQIDYGGTMFFESYSPSWNSAVGRNGAVPNCQSGYTSLGHPWGAGVVSWLSSEVLGVRATSPGFATMEFKPHLGDALQWVEGDVPTPHGLATLACNLVEGSYRVSIPPGTRARVGIPMSGARRRIYSKGRVVWDGSLRETTGIGGATTDEAYVYLEGVEAGRYHFRFAPAPRRQAETLPALRYKMEAPKEDAETQGNWTGRYGKGGYVLFNFDGVDRHRSRLPRYVASVKPSKRKLGHCLHAQLENNTADVRAPQSDERQGTHRRIGQLYTGDPRACQQTMSIDIRLEGQASYQLALYCVDWEDLGRRQAIEIFDLDGLGRLTPVHVISTFTQGRYIVYRCDRSVRLRINQIRGRNAVLNALYFDPVS